MTILTQGKQTSKQTQVDLLFSHSFVEEPELETKFESVPQNQIFLPGGRIFYTPYYRLHCVPNCVILINLYNCNKLLKYIFSDASPSGEPASVDAAPPVVADDAALPVEDQNVDDYKKRLEEKKLEHQRRQQEQREAAEREEDEKIEKIKANKRADMDKKIEV